MHLDSCYIKLDKLQDIGLTCTHLNSCCKVGAIYSKKIMYSLILFILCTLGRISHGDACYAMIHCYIQTYHKRFIKPITNAFRSRQ